MPRGTIEDRERRRQLLDYADLAIGTITPTDLDGLIDYHDEAFAFLEIKYRGRELLRGQRVAISRIVDILQGAGRRAILFVADHEIDDPAVDVDASTTIVRYVYTKGRVYTPCGVMTLRQGIDRFFAKALQGVLAAADMTPDVSEFRWS